MATYSSRYRLTITIDVHDPDALIRAARDYVEGCDAIEDEINSVADALPYAIEAGIIPLNHGFEIVNKTCNQIFRARKPVAD